jgi:hypothetical protein
MSGVEHAAGDRSLEGGGPFPADWGPAPVDVEERGRWIRFHAERATFERRRLARARLEALERRAALRGPG